MDKANVAHTYNGHYLDLNKNKTPAHAITRMDLENMVPSEPSWTQKDKHYRSQSTLTKYLEQSNSKTKVDSGHQVLGRGEEEQLAFNGYRDPVWDDEKVVKMDSGDGRATK